MALLTTFSIISSRECTSACIPTFSLFELCDFFPFVISSLFVFWYQHFSFEYLHLLLRKYLHSLYFVLFRVFFSFDFCLFPLCYYRHHRFLEVCVHTSIYPLTYIHHLHHTCISLISMLWLSAVNFQYQTLAFHQY